MSSDAHNPANYYLFSIEYPERSTPIRGRSVMDLYRSYSIGSLVGFVGSGASVALGYDTWFSFADKLGKYVTQMHGDPPTRAGTVEQMHRDKLAEALKEWAKNMGSADQGELFDVLALAGELAELLDPKLHNDCAGQERDTGKKRNPAVVAKPGKNGTPGNTLSLAEFYKERFLIKPRQFAAVLDVLAELGPDLKARVQKIYDRYLEDYVSGKKAGAPMPADYASGEVLLRSFSKPVSKEENDEEKDKERNKEGDKERDKERDKATEPITLLAERRPTQDVLGCLRNGWKISRYVTLNYDHEIERTLEDYSFPFYSLTPDTRDVLAIEPEETRHCAPAMLAGRHFAVARSRLGERALSIDLCPENMDELMLFAANFSSARLQVLHLHGSVRDPTTMIVNDSDYNARYYVDNGWSTILEDGQSLLFRGNSILFVGIGMNEDELLRPLRILAQSVGREGHPVYAFLPSKGDYKDTALAIKLYQRYGMRTVFYGTELGTDKEFGNFDTHSLVRDWKSHIKKKLNREVEVDCTNLVSLPKEQEILGLLSKIMAAVTKLKPVPHANDAGSKGESMSAERVNEIKEELNFFQKKLKSRLAKHLGIDKIGKNFDIEDIPVEKLPRLLLTPWHSDIFKLVLRCVLTDNLENEFAPEQLDTLEKAVRGLGSAIMTRALADGLNFVVDRASNWRRRWTYFPGHDHKSLKRPAFRRLPDEDEMPVRLLRHVCVPLELHGESALARSDGAISAEETTSAAKNESISADKTAFVVESDKTPMRANTGIAYGMADTITRDAVDESYADDVSSAIGTEFEVDTRFHTYIDPEQCAGQARKALKSKSGLVICHWPSGTGKGHAASLMAAPDLSERSGIKRAVIVFSQSCEFDSCFDLLGKLIHLVRTSGVCAECVLVHADLIFSNRTSVTKLAEWDVILRLLIGIAVQKNPQVKLIVLCEHPETRDYFIKAASKKPAVDRESATSRDATDDPRPYALVPAPELLRESCELDRADASKVVSHIVRRCKSRWIALFLTRLIERIKVSRDRRNLLDDLCHCLRIVQDPRQRVAHVVDVAMNHFERHVIAHETKEDRLQKIVAHAIMRHLFALGMPVRSDVLRYCPQIKGIFSVYKVKDESKQNDLVNGALNLLLDLRLVLGLYRHVNPDNHLRLGLHGSARMYLSSKKSLPFTRQPGKEEVALTVLPILAEEVVPLEADDFAFLESLFDALVGAYEDNVTANQTLAVECIRAAFGLLRGSMRIGVVLRATPSATEQGGRSPLDSYFLRLLAIRLATLRVAALSSHAAAYAWPLYEREWVWLFNEMGVVRMLQGNIYDAIPLLEQAIDFEEARLVQENGYEGLIYPGRKNRRFSVNRLRIFINLSMAALERGSFDRVSRIAERDLATLRKQLRKLATPNGEKDGGFRKVEPATEPETEQQSDDMTAFERTSKENVRRALVDVSPHRELRILILACELTNARLQYLSGAIGSAERWLRRNRKEVLEVGVHGLTASFFKVFADVKQRKGDSVRATKYLSIARAEAEASGRPDIILGVMLAEAEQARDLRASGSTLLLRHHLGRLRKIENEAKRFGMAHIEATVCLVRSRLYLGFGEHRSAREDIMRVLTLTMVNGLRVKRIAALIVMAALLAADETSATPRVEALHMVEAARREAERMGYKLAAVNAMELEIVLARRGSIEDWATSRVASAADSPNASVSQG